MGMQKTIKVDVGVTQQLWPYRVVNVIQAVMEEGELNHPHGSWEEISIEEHIKHADVHLGCYLSDDTTEDHLAHALTRLMMAVAIDRGYGVKGGK